MVLGEGLEKLFDMLLCISLSLSLYINFNFKFIRATKSYLHWN